MKYKEIIGGTKAEAEKKFPWLRKAGFYDAVIALTHTFLTWHGGAWFDGTWEGGTWESGTWQGGYWKGGTWQGGTWEGGYWESGTWESGTWQGGYWKGGTWQGGTWKGGSMWSNIRQRYIKVVQNDGKFIERPSRAEVKTR